MPVVSFFRAFFGAFLWAFPYIWSSLALAGTTELILPVKYHHQEHSLSCEAAALTMVLNYYGVAVSESDVLKKMPVDRTPHAHGIWGDPDTSFVGNVDGEMSVDGYGIHLPGLQRLASLWKHTTAIRAGDLRDLTMNLEKRRPIIVWGYAKSPGVSHWVTRTGRRITALVSEHTRVVYGFRGKAASPDGFFVMDPENGSHYWPSAEFLKNWKSLGKTGLVLYPDDSD